MDINPCNICGTNNYDFKLILNAYRITANGHGNKIMKIYLHHLIDINPTGMLSIIRMHLLYQGSNKVFRNL